MNCSSTTLETESSAVIICYISDTFNQLNISYSAVSGSDKIIYKNTDGSVEVFSAEVRRTITLNNGLLNITVANTTCSDDGTFTLDMLKDSTVTSTTGTITIKGIFHSSPSVGHHLSVTHSTEK